jgi:hypothetical protein
MTILLHILLAIYFVGFGFSIFLVLLAGREDWLRDTITVIFWPLYLIGAFIDENFLK